MTIVQLEYIIAVDTYKSFAEAAQKTYVTQPALSMQIKKVEAELGILIFDRSKKPIVTTDIGRQIVIQAKETVRQAKRIYSIIDNQRDEISGELRVGIIPTLSPYLLPLFITDFMDKYKDVKVIVEELLSEQIIYKLNNDQLDVGVLVSPLNNPNLVETSMFYEPFIVYTSAKHDFFNQKDVALEDLNINEIYLLKEGNCLRSQVLNLCDDLQQNSTNNLQFESGSLETLKRLVEHYNGYTLLPELATFDMSEEQYARVKHFEVPQPVREVSLVTHQSFMKQKLIAAFQESILNKIPPQFKKKPEGKVVNWN